MNPNAEAWRDLWFTVISYGCIFGGGGLAAAALCFFMPVHVRRWLPLQRIRFGHWTGGQLAFILCLANVVAPIVVMLLLDKSGFYQYIYARNASLLEEQLWTLIVSLPLSLAVVFIPLYAMSRAGPQDLGLSRNRWPVNCMLGYFGFAAITPLVLCMQYLLSLGVETKRHSFLELLGADTIWIDWVLAFFVVCVAAPVLEEVMFRGLILGWLRRASLIGHIVFLAAFGSLSFLSAFKFDFSAVGENKLALPGIEAIFWGRLDFTALMLGLCGFYLVQSRRKNLFLTEADFVPAWWTPPQPENVENQSTAITTHFGLDEATRHWVQAQARWQTHDREQQRRKGWLAVFVSSVAFALVHTAWPDPVPLLFLALLLGWLAHRTQNLLPGIVLHALFNAVSFLAMLLVSCFGA